MEGEQRQTVEVEHVTNKMRASHAVEVEKIKSDMLTANISQSEQLAQSEASHKEEMALAF